MIKQLLALLLLLSVSFAWTITPPGQAVSILGYTFVRSTINTAISGTYSCDAAVGSYMSAGTGQITGCSFWGESSGEANFAIPDGTTQITCNNGQVPNPSYFVAIDDFAKSQELILFCSQPGSLATINVSQLNSTHVFFTNGSANMTIARTDKFFKIISNMGVTATVTASNYNSTLMTNDIPVLDAVNKNRNVTISDGYLSLQGTSILRSNFKTATKPIFSDTSTYCRALLYFNNPYYGNIQLLPSVTYIPSVNAFGNFYNTTDNSAYLPNGSIAYIFDSVTATWYIVPAYTCSVYSAVGSTSVLQYNPTGITNTTGGTVPIDITSISGSCTFNTATNVITCTATDTSNTITSMNLSAYLTGNTTPVCSSSSLGASATLTCTLPNVNGTYSAYLYGTDSNLFVHTLGSTTVTIGGSGTTVFGRDGFLAALIIVVVAAMVATWSIPVSMVLACFGLFMSIAFGIIPAGTSVLVAILLVVVALMLAYRLKV